MKKFLVALVACLFVIGCLPKIRPPHETGDVWTESVTFGTQIYIATCKCGEDLVALCIVETKAGDYTDITFQPNGLCREPDCEECEVCETCPPPECKPGTTDPRCSDIR